MKTRGVRQRDISDCGAACLAFIAAYYKHHASVAKLRQWAGTDKYGTSVYGLLKAAEKVGLDGQGVKCESRDPGSLHYPFIAHCILKNGANHYVVVTGVTHNDAVIMDPTDGRYRKTAIDDFRSAWSGVAVMLEPGNTFIKKKTTSSLHRIIKLVKPHNSALLAAGVCSIFFTVVAVGMTAYIQQVVDLVFEHGKTELLPVISMIVICAVVFQAGLSVVKGQLIIRTSRYLDKTLILGYYKHILYLPKVFHDNMRTGEVMSRINDALRINMFINEVFIAFVIDLLMIVLSIVLMFIYSWKMGMMLLMVLPVYFLLFLRSDHLNKRWQPQILQEGANVDGLIAESLHNVNTVKQLAIESYAFQKTSTHFEKLAASTFASSRKHLDVYAATDFFTRSFTIIVVWAGCYLVFNGEISKGELLSFFAMMSYFTAPAISLISAGKSARETLIACDRLFEIMDLEPEFQADQENRMEDATGNIIFADVNFRYGNGPLVLEHFNLHIRKGSVTGIKGESGAGKSTIVALLLRLYEPEAGEISIGGLALTKIDHATVRRKISIAPQHTELFNSTIRENISFNGHEPDDERLNDIAFRTGLLDFTAALPEGLDTKIVEQGSNLSGGQKQKISIARALYRDAPILVLDEPTASLDAVSEAKIMQTIDWYKKKGNTVIIISHSDTALKICDNIVILKN